MIPPALRRPALAVLLIAPIFGEGLSTATPPLDLLLPWNLALMVALYGCGALLCREIAFRNGLGTTGLLLLAAAYAVYEEALVDRFWFTPKRWHDAGLDHYSAVWHTNLLLAAHLTLFHMAVSIGASVLVVERLFPERRATPWAGRRGRGVSAAALLVVPPLLFGQYDVQPLPQLVVAAALTAGLVALAFHLPRRRLVRRRVRAAGWIAFVCTAAQFVLTYAVRSMGLSWPLGLVVALVPAAVGLVALRGDDGLKVVTGILAFFCLLSIVIGLGGRYDTTLLGVAVAFGLFWLRRHPGVVSR